MSNLFVLKTNIFEAQAGVVNLFCRTSRSRPVCCYCFNIQPLLQKVVSFLNHQYFDTKYQYFSHARLCPSNSFSFLSTFTFLHVFSASTLTLEVSALFPHFLALQLLDRKFHSFFLLVDFSVVVVS